MGSGLRRIGNILLAFVPLAMTLIIQFGVSLVLMVPAAFIGKETGEDVILAVYAAVVIVLFDFWYHNIQEGDRDCIDAGRSVTWKILLSLALLAVGTQYLMGYLIGIVGYIRPDWMDAYNELIDSSGIVDGTLIMSVYCCVLAPISEELTFRGLSFGYARRGLPLGAAMVLQAVLFGVFHMNMIQGIYAGTLGVFLGYVCWKGDSLFLAVLFHAGFNIAGTYLVDYMYFGKNEIWGILYLPVSIALTVGGIWMFRQGVQDRNLKLKVLQDPGNTPYYRT